MVRVATTTMTFPGTPSALRGYRLQHLYTLFRILVDDAPAGQQFQLEGTEDLEILDDAGRLIEAIQVKARSSAPLNPSALTGKAGESFFRRAVERLERDPRSKQRVVSFDEIGPTLQALGEGGSASTEAQRDRLEHLGVPSDRTDVFRAAFDVEQVDEEEIEREVLQLLAATISAGNPEVAFLYLSAWMWGQMEKRRKVTAADVRDRLLAVGRFIAEAQAHAAEWFTTIEPIEESAIDEVQRGLLVRDFYEGVSARFEHILAGVDVARRHKVAEVNTAFIKSNVVIVHGASGQGKTALACRYLLDANPSAWRFRVRELQDIPHARRVALALRSHAEAVGVPMIVWLDVAPQDTAWTRVVEDLETLSNTHVLVTIREEDWTRARNAGATLRYAEVDLTLDEQEGRGIFEGLQRYRISQEFLDFDDAWRRFGGGGPLMEFTYLVTRGDALEAKLEQQIRRLREEVRLGAMSAAEIELLRRVAVGTAAGGRIRLMEVIIDLALPDPKASLQRFEHEYLLRVSQDGLYAEGLHPLRSGTIARLLTDDGFDPSWLDTAVGVLPAIDEADLEPFLLSLFSQPADHDRLKTALMTFSPKTWSGGAGIVRALLWRGMHEYASRNAELIKEVVEQMNGSELALAVLDPAGLQKFSPTLAESLEEIFRTTPANRSWYEAIQARRPSNACVIRDASEWLHDAPSFVAPASPSDWAGMAEVLFWLSAWGSASAERGATAVEDLTRAANDVSLDAAADVIFALSFWDEALLTETFDTVRQSLLDRFQVELRTFAIITDEAGATAHYVVSLDESQNLHEETIRRLDLMRRLLPEEPAFGAQAYGHIFGSALFPHDPSKKRGVPAESFPMPWVTRLSRLFSLIAGIRMGGISWGTYADTIVKLRRMVVTLAGITTDTLRKYFNRDTPRSVFEIGVDRVAWYGATVALHDLPRLPRSAVDDWGFELRQNSEIRSVDARSEHADWDEALRKYASSLHDFLKTSTPYFLANCHLGRPTAGSSEAAAKALEGTNFKVHLATHHLAEALRSLRDMQREYRSRFGRFADAVALSQLEADEQDRLWTLLSVWYQFAERPKQYFGDARRESLAEVLAVLKKRRTDLKRRLESIAEAQVVIHQERGQWEEGKGLWLTMNVEESGNLYLALDTTLAQMIEALRPPPDFHAFDWYVLDLVWRDVHVVPLVRGKSVARSAWNFRIVAFPQPGETIEPWHLIDRPVDESVWNELKLDVWPVTLGGAARRLQGELIAVSFLMDHLLRFENAPEPDAVGRPILIGHWNDVMKTIGQHAASAASAAAECPVSLFSDGDVSLNVLRTYCEQTAKDVESLEPYSFDRLREVSEQMNVFLSGTLATVVHAAIDNDLATTESSATQ